MFTINQTYVLLTIHTALVENVSTPGLEEIKGLFLIIYFTVHDDDDDIGYIPEGWLRITRISHRMQTML